MVRGTRRGGGRRIGVGEVLSERLAGLLQAVERRSTEEWRRSKGHEFDFTLYQNCRVLVLAGGD